jgi:hypothetical protein
MEKHPKKIKNWIIKLVIIIIFAVLCPSHSAIYSQYSKNLIQEKLDPKTGSIWHNVLNLTIPKSVIDFDPNLHGVNFDTTLLRSDDLSSIYTAIKEKIVWKDGKSFIGSIYVENGLTLKSETIALEKGEHLSLRFCEKSLIRLICDFKVTQITFTFNRVFHENAQLGNSGITLSILADINKVEVLKSELEKQSYVYFVGRQGFH